MTESEKPPLILLMGPTAAGKTDLALELIEQLPLEIVSVDSAMVYRGLNIGSGKPSAEVLSKAPHRLVDILDPSERYSAGQFVRDALLAIADIRARGKVPLLVGGTMLYFKALTQGLAELPPADPQFRADLDRRARQEGWPALHAELARVDAVAALKILPNDGQRIQRALEVFTLTGRPISELHRETVRYTLNDNCLLLAWSPNDRAALYARIEQRFERMLAEGFLAEVQGLFARGDLTSELPAIRSVGYRQLWNHIAGHCELNTAVQLGITATRHLARRQLIWLRAMPEICWFDSLDSSACDHIKQYIARNV